MRPRCSLPIDPSFAKEDDYIDSLLAFAASNELFSTLCGGVHVLDFLTREPDLYSAIIPESWRLWFAKQNIDEILHILIHEDIATLESRISKNAAEGPIEASPGVTSPPQCLLEYTLGLRRLSLRRDFGPRQNVKVQQNRETLQKAVFVGMKPKKIHEVQNFASYVDQLLEIINSSTAHEISSFIDFGSGQSYLGRVLASSPFNRPVMALESKEINIKGAKAMDVHAKIAEKEKVVRNKKDYRALAKTLPKMISEDSLNSGAENGDSNPQISRYPEGRPLPLVNSLQKGHIIHIQKLLQSGELSDVLPRYHDVSGNSTTPRDCLVISLHSCGNLIHHGLRSLILNPEVKAVAMVGCCYNLVTERLGPPTYKLPSLRNANMRLEETSTAFDPHGFPMSERLCHYKHKHGEGVRCNITARMMAVQAPQNWTREECDSFFTRHFYRALLQKIFLDRGVIPGPANEDQSQTQTKTSSSGVPAITIGSLRKSCYVSFQAYVRGAVEKISQMPDVGTKFAEGMKDITDEDICRYEEQHKGSKKELSIVWTLMALSAGIVEAIMVVDRWLYLRERPEVQDCWVETVFDYKLSPRNLVVVGIKKQKRLFQEKEIDPIH